VTRLRRSDCSTGGIRRRRCGKGFSYTDPDGSRIRDPEVLERIRSLAIPPAWKDVWICPASNGHIQATGLDDAGRRQYRYHDAWHTRASTVKFEQMLEFARMLPGLRRAVNRDIALDGLPPERAAAGAVRLIDLTLMRIGSEQYAEENGTFGAATLRRDHVTRDGDRSLVVRFTGKSGVEHDHLVRDRDLAALAADLRRRRSGSADFFVYRDDRRWVDLTSPDINAYIQRHTSPDCSAKDFRTWGATVTAAVALARIPPETCESRAARQKSLRGVIAEVAAILGNTPAVCRSSYIDPRVSDRFLDGETIRVPGRTRIRLTERKTLIPCESAVRSFVASA
jgi:DNA topoisomerase IB